MGEGVPGAPSVDWDVMDMNMILAVVGIVVVVVALIAVSVWMQKSRKKDLDKALDRSGAQTVGAGAGTGQPKAAFESVAESAAESKPESSGTSGTGTSEPESEPASEPEQPEPTKTAQALDAPESVGSRMTRLKAKLAGSANPFGKALFNILAKDNLSEDDWQDVEDTLLLADVGAEASERLVEELRTDARVTGKADASEVRAALREKLLDVVGRDTDRRLNADKDGANKPSVIIMVGVNGTGKTTTAGKLARLSWRMAEGCAGCGGYVPCRGCDQLRRGVRV